MYLCSISYEPAREISYEPAREHGIDPLDPELAIAWPGAVEPILSGKDARAPSLAQARFAGLLPGYADGLAHAARLRGS
jgi:dTDP-4-dehydrorhamnose 3,5-epimerase-like enzyme